MDVKIPLDTHDIVLRGILERKRRQMEGEKKERELKNIEPIKDKYYFDLETETYLKKVAQKLFDDYEHLPNEKKQRVLEEITDEVTLRGPPETPIKILLRDTVNRLL
jgi:hypothetical protein